LENSPGSRRDGAAENGALAKGGCTAAFPQKGGISEGTSASLSAKNTGSTVCFSGG